MASLGRVFVVDPGVGLMSQARGRVVSPGGATLEKLDVLRKGGSLEGLGRCSYSPPCEGGVGGVNSVPPVRNS